jgi:rRNA maturation endonuclease Nob1
MYCHACGIALTQQTKYCNRCGVQLIKEDHAVELKRSEKRLDEE